MADSTLTIPRMPRSLGAAYALARCGNVCHIWKNSAENRGRCDLRMSSSGETAYGLQRTAPCWYVCAAIEGHSTGSTTKAWTTGQPKLRHLHGISHSCDSQLSSVRILYASGRRCIAMGPPIMSWTSTPAIFSDVRFSMRHLSRIVLELGSRVWQNESTSGLNMPVTSFQASFPASSTSRAAPRPGSPMFVMFLSTCTAASRSSDETMAL